MKCKKCQNLVFEYLDKTVSKRQEKTIEKHLRHCVHCAAIYSEEKRLSSFIAEGMENIAGSLSLDIDGDHIESLMTTKEAVYKRRTTPAARRGFGVKRMRFRLTTLTSVAAMVVLCIISLVIKRTCVSKPNGTDISPVLTAFTSPDLLLSDSLDDWHNRRIVITIQDKNGKITKQIITSGNNEEVIVYPEKR